MRVGAAAQDDGIAGLEAEPAGIGGHVGAALEDDADDAERRAHALNMETVRPVPFGDDRADRVGKRGDRLKRLRHALQPRGIERGAVDQRLGEAARPHGGDVLRVGGEDLRLAPARSRRRPR